MDSNMNVEFEIKKQILIDASKYSEFQMPSDEDMIDFYDENRWELDEISDAESEFRCSGIDTELKCECSRHYESKQVAKQLDNGMWVSWTYWYGGGKWGEPEAVDWIEHAYLVDCNEEEKTVVVRTFSKAA